MTNEELFEIAREKIRYIKPDPGYSTDDILQEFYLTILENPPKDIRNPRSYVYQILHNLMIRAQKEVKGNKFEHKHTSLSEDFTPGAGLHMTKHDLNFLKTDESIDYEKLLIHLDSVNTKLEGMEGKLKYSEILRLRLDGYTVKEIAEEYNMQPKQINNILTRIQHAANEFWEENNT